MMKLKRRTFFTKLLPAVFLTPAGMARLAAEEAAQDSSALVRAAMEASASLEGVPFREVVKAATGRDILPVKPEAPEDRALLDHVAKAADELLRRLNAPDSPARGLARVNEVSRLAEDHLRELLNSGDFSCEFPRPAGGRAARRSGYPDLRLTHLPSGRVTYLDPKLFEETSRRSSLRTFYYEPKTLTGKITDDARHLLLGVSHDGRDGAWTFLKWELLDLYTLRVRLKAEFQASNRDLYQNERILRSGGAPPDDGRKTAEPREAKSN